MGISFDGTLAHLKIPSVEALAPTCVSRNLEDPNFKQIRFGYDMRTTRRLMSPLL